MAVFFVLAGLVLLVTGINGTVGDAGKLIKGDFTGPNNFIVWIIAIVLAGSLGYFPKFRPISYGFLTLVFVVIILSSGSGFFSKLQETTKALASGDVLKPQQTSGANQSILANFDFSPDDIAKYTDVISSFI